MSGWIKLHRSLIDWEWYTDHNTSRLFIHCLLRANHTDHEWRGIFIKRGSFYTSLNTLSSETGLSLRQIRTSFDKLILTGELTSSGMARGRMITIHEYDSYQEDDRLNGSQMTGNRQADDRVATTNKNDKNDKNNTPKYEEGDLKLAEWIYEQVILISPHTKQPNFVKWANTIRLMRTQDKLNHRLIAEVFKWANEDSFWKSNILSPSKLRDKFATLHAKKESENEINQRPNQPKPSLVDRINANTTARREERASRRFGGQPMGENGSDVRTQVCEPIRGDAGRDLDNVLDGDYRTTDG